MTIITRFAPSPTGYLHIGGARTALYNWLYAKANGGKFLLRIEDTDRERSTQPAIDAILRSMRWLGMDWDGEEVYQFARASRHAEVAEQLVKDGKAYYCYTSPEELTAFRAANPHAKYRSPWREGGTPPADIKPVIRLKAPIKGETIVYDGVKGTVSVQNAEMDDMVLLRSDGTPTYMLAVVVDDHDMNVTHVIRGDDHFTNTFRQIQLYDACGWSKPHFSHVPMILGSDGAKLSKRHGALGVEEYQKMGFLPEALNNYLLRLGWSHGDDEIISQQQAIEWFNLEHISNSPARFDMEKLKSVNAHYMRNMDEEELITLLLPLLPALDTTQVLKKILPALKERTHTLVELAASAAFLFEMQPLDEKAKKTLDEAGKAHLNALPLKLEYAEWDAPALETCVKDYITEVCAKFPAVGMPVRAMLTGTTNAPAVHEIMAALGKNATLKRINMETHKLYSMSKNEPEELIELLIPVFENMGIVNEKIDKDLFRRALPHFGARGCASIEELAEDLLVLLVRPSNITVEATWNPYISTFIDQFDAELEWNKNIIQKIVGGYISRKILEVGTTFIALRRALTGKPEGASPYEIMFALGKDETIARLKAVL